MKDSPKRWWALAALTLSVLIVALDGTIINVALPTLAAELGASPSQLQWIGGGYLLTLSVGMLPIGLLGDRVGHRKVLLVGIALFAAASLAGALATTAGGVIAARAAMGLGAAMIMPLTMALLPSLFSKEEMPRAISVWTAATALGMPAGPLAGGWLLDHFWWGSVFVFNLPVAGIAFVAAAFLLPTDPARTGGRRPFDLRGTLLGGFGITALVYASIQVPERGWGDVVTLVPLAGAAVLLVLFVLRERSFSDPILAVKLFRLPSFAWGTGLAVFVNFTVMGVLFVVPQYFAGHLGSDALGTGLRVLPLIGGLMVAAALVEPLVPRLGARVVVPTGLVILGAGALLGATTSASDGYGFVAVWLTMSGVGFGLAVVPTTAMALGSLPEGGEGTGTSLLESVQQVGAVLGIAVLGSLFAAGRHGSAPFVHGMDRVLVAVGALALIVAVPAALRLPRSAPTPAPAADKEGEWVA